MNNTRSECSKTVWTKQRQSGEFYKTLDRYKWTSIRLLKCKLKQLIWREGAYTYVVKEQFGKYKTWEMDASGSWSYLMLDFGVCIVEPSCSTKKKRDVLSINCLIEHRSTYTSTKCCRLTVVFFVFNLKTWSVNWLAWMRLLVFLNFCRQ